MATNIIRILLTTSWLTLFFIPPNTIKRFLPVTTLSSLITMTIVFVGTHYDFWKIKNGKKAKIYNLLSIVLGGFSVGTLWIFKLSYGNFKKYLIANLVQNLIYTFPIISLFDKVNFIKYVKFTRFHHLIVALIISIILYGYQMFLERSESSYSQHVKKSALY